MRKKAIAGFMAVIMALSLSGCNDGGGNETEDSFSEYSMKIAKQVYKDYFVDLGEGDTYVKYFVPSKQNEPDKAYLWPYMEVASLNARLMTIVEPSVKISENKTVKQFYKEIVDGFKYYRSSRKDYTVYTASRAAVPNFGSGDTYYDDNLWVAREFLNAYQLLRDDSGGKVEEYLTKAKEVTAFVLSGWDDEHSGIKWFDGVKGVGHPDYGETRNTCSNAPTVILLCRLYDITKDESYYEWAKRIYEFTKTKLMDTDGTYFDNVKWNESLKKDVIERTKWTYNSGSMIAAGVLLYELESDVVKKAQYLADAKKTAEGAHNYFATDLGYSAKIYPPQPWFNVLLLDGYIELFKIEPEFTKPFIDSMYDALDFGYKKNRDANGYVSPDWVSGWKDKNKEPKSVLDMAANAENYGLLAYAQNKLNYNRQEV